MSATIRDVARAAEVSVATVSRALNAASTVAAPTRNRILRIAGELDYVPHSGARSLSTRRTDTVGVLLPDLHGEFFSELIRGIDIAARASGLHLLLSHSHGDPAEAVAALRAMRSRVDAMLVMSPHVDDDVLAVALKGALPLVLLSGNRVPGPHPTFSIDNRAGALALTRHLVAGGHRRIAFVAGPADNLEAGERLAGYRAGLAEAGLAEQVLPGDFGEASGLAAGQALLADGLPDALFAANDTMAIGVLLALRAARVRVPGDVALAGFDDVPVSRLLDPPLTSVGVPIAAIGEQAFASCVQLIRGEDAGGLRLFTPELVVRASTGGQNTGSNRGDRT